MYFRKKYKASFYFYKNHFEVMALYATYISYFIFFQKIVGQKIVIHGKRKQTVEAGSRVYRNTVSSLAFVK